MYGRSRVWNSIFGHQNLDAIALMLTDLRLFEVDQIAIRVLKVKPFYT